MILRRITQHVRNQNWFAVLIDFIIVVVGVFTMDMLIPFDETRGYVKNVMSNTVAYSLLLNNASTPLKQRLGIIYGSK